VKTFRLQTELLLPRPLAEIFPFFSDAHNLERLTPPWLHFQILASGPIEMKMGTLIDYRLRVHGIPVHWQSQITKWEPPYRFVDRQTRGPYRLWVHEHTFSENGKGTLVKDTVEYAVLGGKLVQKFLVAPDLKRIFAYRHQRLLETFASPLSF